MANSVDPEPSHLDLHCLLKYLFWSAGLKQNQKKPAYLRKGVTQYRSRIHTEERCVLMSLMVNEGPDQFVHPCSLIRLQ